MPYSVSSTVLRYSAHRCYASEGGADDADVAGATLANSHEPATAALHIELSPATPACADHAKHPSTRHYDTLQRSTANEVHRQFATAQIAPVTQRLVLRGT